MTLISWTFEEDEILYQHYGSGDGWTVRASRELPGRSPVACQSRVKTIEDRERLGVFDRSVCTFEAWNNGVREDEHVDLLVSQGGFPRYLRHPDTGRLTPYQVNLCGLMRRAA